MVRRESVAENEFPPIVVVRNSADAGQLDIGNLFGNCNQLEVDIGCGKGRFLIARASGYPERNFLGIERQAGRVLRTARKAERAGLVNVRLARVEAFEGLGKLLAPGSVAVFYIFFPDPWPKRRHHRRRLINPDFMDVMYTRLAAGGVIHFASDHAGYAAEVARVFGADERFEEIDAFQPTEAEQTDFEIIFRGQEKPIQRVSIRKRA
jgi:tRNA (guanine-N7-)-methyltransferase